MIVNSDLKYSDILSVDKYDVIVDGEQPNEGEEERCGRGEVPHVVVVEEIHHVAYVIHVPGIRNLQCLVQGRTSSPRPLIFNNCMISLAYNYKQLSYYWT